MRQITIALALLTLTILGYAISRSSLFERNDEYRDCRPTTVYTDGIHVAGVESD